MVVLVISREFIHKPHGMAVNNDADHYSSTRPCPINVSLPSPPLDSIRVMVIVWTLRGNIIITAPWWVV